MTRLQEIVAIIVGVLAIASTVIGFGFALMRRWWNLEQWIKTSIENDRRFRETDRKLKRSLQNLVRQKYSDHTAFEARFSSIEDRLDAIQNSRRRRGLPSNQR